MIVEVLLLVVGWVLGVVLYQILKHLLNKPPSAMCGCHHHLSFHDEEGCHFIDRWAGRDITGHCGCLRFIPKDNPTAALIEFGERSLRWPKDAQ